MYTKTALALILGATMLTTAEAHADMDKNSAICDHLGQSPETADCTPTDHGIDLTINAPGGYEFAQLLCDKLLADIVKNWHTGMFTIDLYTKDGSNAFCWHNGNVD